MTPGQDGSAHAEMAAAEDALKEAIVLMGAGLPQGAVSRLYYAAFHAARAALTVRGQHAKTHAGQIALFGQVFGSAAELQRWFEARLTADYAFAPSTIEIGRLADEIASVRAFIDRCKEIVANAAAQGANEPDPPPDL